MTSIVPLMARAAGGLALLLWLPVLLIRAQPYDSGPVRDLLLPADHCPDVPCWKGMRPGITTLEEASAFFESQPGTDYFIEASDSAANLAVLFWRDPDNRFSGSLHFADYTLAEITLNGLELYEVWLALGDPDGGQMLTEMVYLDAQRFISLPTAHVGYYRANHFRLTILSSCGWFWRQRAYIILGPTIIPDKLDTEVTWASQRRIACQRLQIFERAQREATR